MNEQDERDLQHYREMDKIKDWLFDLGIWSVKVVVAYVIFWFAMVGVKTVITDFKLMNLIQVMIFATAVLWALINVGLSGPLWQAFHKSTDWASPLLEQWKRQFQAASKAWRKARDGDS
jgi:hypothetical protein